MEDKIILTLTQEAYITGPHEDPWFEAAAIDPEGEDYMVHWTITDDDVRNGTADDWGCACDWSHPSAIYRGGDDVTGQIGRIVNTYGQTL